MIKLGISFRELHRPAVWNIFSSSKCCKISHACGRPSVSDIRSAYTKPSVQGISIIAYAEGLDGEPSEQPFIINTDEWVEVGIIGPPHGVRGECRVQPLTDFPEERLGEPGSRWLRAPIPRIRGPSAVTDTPPTQVELEWGRASVSKGREVWLVKIEGIESPEEVGAIRGHVLLVPAAERAPLEDADEFYVQDLIGLRVEMLETGDCIGHVVDIFDGTGTHDVLRIKLTEGAIGNGLGSDANTRAAAERPRYVLVPFAKEIVPVVDTKEGVMCITPPDGLFDLAMEAPQRQRRKEVAGKRERRKPKRRQEEGTNNAEITPDSSELNE